MTAPDARFKELVKRAAFELRLADDGGLLTATEVAASGGSTRIVPQRARPVNEG